MKRKTLIVFGGSLVAVCLVAGWYRLGRGSQDITLRFVGYEAAGDQRWLAVFRAANGTYETVSCRPGYESGFGQFVRADQALHASKVLAPHTEVTWGYPVTDTNSVRRIEINCWKSTPVLFSRANDVIGWFGKMFPDHRWPLLQGRDYVVTCTTEAH